MQKNTVNTGKGTERVGTGGGHHIYIYIYESGSVHGHNKSCMATDETMACAIGNVVLSKNH